MNDQRLSTLNTLKQRIDDIDAWLRIANKVWILRLTMKVPKLLLNTVPYGVYREETFECDEALRQKVFKVIDEHQRMLRDEYYKA